MSVLSSKVGSIDEKSSLGLRGVTVRLIWGDKRENSSFIEFFVLLGVKVAFVRFVVLYV